MFICPRRPQDQKKKTIVPSELESAKQKERLATGGEIERKSLKRSEKVSHQLNLLDSPKLNKDHFQLVPIRE